MHSYTAVFINVLVFACSAAILMTLWMTVFFEAVYIRDVSSNGQNASVRNGGSEWPFKMRLQGSSFLCTTPSPNLDFTEDQLTSAWQLPQRTRLSPTMRDIARCELAVEWSRIKGEWFDESRCFCVDVWWVPVLFIMASMTLGYYGIYNTCRLPRTFGPINDPDELRSGRCGSGFWFTMWYSILCLYSIRNFDAGMSHTPYGGMQPQAFYNKEPVQWFVVFVFSMAICVLEGVKILIYTNAILKLKLKPDRMERRIVVSRDKSPPPYEAVSFEKMWEKAAAV